MKNINQIDKDMIYKRLTKLEEFYQILVELQALTEQEFLTNYKNFLTTQRALEFAINICIDIGSHIESVLINKSPDTYANIFENLEKANLISSPLSKKIVDMVRFRNMLGHVYMEIDNSMIYTILQENIDDIMQFKQEIVQLLERKPQ